MFIGSKKHSNYHATFFTSANLSFKLVIGRRMVLTGGNALFAEKKNIHSIYVDIKSFFF